MSVNLDQLIDRLAKSIYSIVQSSGHSRNGETEEKIFFDYLDAAGQSLRTDLNKVGYQSFFKFVKAHMSSKLIPAAQHDGSIRYFVGNVTNTQHLQNLINRTKSKSSPSRLGKTMNASANRRRGAGVGRGRGRGSSYSYGRNAYSNHDYRASSSSTYSNQNQLPLNTTLTGLCFDAANMTSELQTHINRSTFERIFEILFGQYPQAIAPSRFNLLYQSTFKTNIKSNRGFKLTDILFICPGVKRIDECWTVSDEFVNFIRLENGLPPLAPRQQSSSARSISTMRTDQTEDRFGGPTAAAVPSTSGAVYNGPSTLYVPDAVVDDNVSPLRIDASLRSHRRIGLIESMTCASTSQHGPNLQMTINTRSRKPSPSDSEHSSDADNCQVTDAEWNIDLPLLEYGSPAIPDSERKKMLILCNRNPQGLTLEELMHKYQALFGGTIAGKRDYRMSFKSLITTLPELRFDSGLDKVFATTPPKHRLESARTRSRSPRIEDIQREIIEVFESIRETRIELSEFEQLFTKFWHKPLDTAKYGYSNLRAVLRSMSDRVLVENEIVYFYSTANNACSAAYQGSNNSGMWTDASTIPAKVDLARRSSDDSNPQRSKLNLFKLVSNQVNMNKKTHGEMSPPLVTFDNSQTNYQTKQPEPNQYYELQQGSQPLFHYDTQAQSLASSSSDYDRDDVVELFQSQSVQLVDEAGTHGISSYFFEDRFQERFGHNIPFRKLGCSGFIAVCDKYLRDIIRFVDSTDSSFTLFPLPQNATSTSTFTGQVQLPPPQNKGVSNGHERKQAYETVDTALRRIHALFDQCNCTSGCMLYDLFDLLNNQKQNIPPNLTSPRHLLSEIRARPDLFQVQESNGSHFIRPTGYEPHFEPEQQIVDGNAGHLIPNWVQQLLLESDQFDIVDLKVFDSATPLPQAPSNWPPNAVPPGYLMPFVNLFEPHSPDDVEQLSEDDTLKLIRVQDVSSPFEFYVTSVDVVDGEDLPLDVLMTEMKKYYTNPVQNDKYKIRPQDIQVGMVVAATYEGNDFQRALVIQVEPQLQEQVSLLYLDYGTKADHVFLSSKVRFLHEKFMSLPAQAVYCQLSAVAPRSNTSECMSLVWSEEACAYFDERVEGIDLYADFRKYDPLSGMFEVALVDTNDEVEEHNLVDLLVDNGFAISFNNITFDGAVNCEDDDFVINDVCNSNVENTEDELDDDDLENELMSDSDDDVQNVAGQVGNLSFEKNSLMSGAGDGVPDVNLEGCSQMSTLYRQFLKNYREGKIVESDLKDGYARLNDHRKSLLAQMGLSNVDTVTLTHAISQTEVKMKAIVAVVKQLGLALS